MDGWLGALVSLSIVLAAAPAVATSPVETVEETVASDEDPTVDWKTSLLIDVGEPSLYMEASLADGTSEGALELQIADTEHQLAVAITPDEDEPFRGPISLEADSSEAKEETDPCVHVYPPQTPPVAVDPDCIPDIDDTVQPH